MNKLLSILLCFLLLFLTACASTPQPRVPLSQNFYSNNNEIVGVYMASLPKPDTHLVGASCLLCMAAASVANSSLTKQTKTFSTEDLEQLGTTIQSLLSSKGVETTNIDSVIDVSKLKKFKSDVANFAKKDFRVLKEKLKVDKLLVIDLHTIGVYRPYSGYISNGDPTGTVLGTIYTVNLNTNSYELYENIDVKVSAQGNWDEPPAFPGVTNAYYQAIELTKSKALGFFN